jgi:hypothetical protein
MTPSASEDLDKVLTVEVTQSLYIHSKEESKDLF